MAQGLQSQGLDAVAVELDVQSEKSVARAFARFGKDSRLDILVNNPRALPAAVPPAQLLQIRLEHWEQALNSHVDGVFLTCRAAVPLMRQRQHGRIVNIFSDAAQSAPGYFSCIEGASMGALPGLTRVLAGEVGLHGITANCLSASGHPANWRAWTAPMLQSLMYDLEAADSPQLSEARGIAEALAFLAGDESAFITGAVLDANGGSFRP